MSFRHEPKPVTDADIGAALRLLKSSSIGLPRSDLPRHFTSDRHGRNVMSYLAENGIAAVITAPHPHREGAKVYKIAETKTELESQLRYLDSYKRSFERRIQGLQLAFEAGGIREPQKGLFNG